MIQKVVRGMPTDWRLFNRFMALLGAALPPEELAAAMRNTVLAEAGDPARYGAIPVDPEARLKLSQSQEYLAYVAEGRISVRPAVESVDHGPSGSRTAASSSRREPIAIDRPSLQNRRGNVMIGA